MARTMQRGEEGYEQARRDAVWNARTPERFPQRIVLAESEQDVIAAVQAATEANLRITVRSGGHSWAGNHLREDCVLLDLSRMQEVEVDAHAMTSTVQPGCHGDELLEQLAQHHCFFPAGHCPGVGIGGYLLQGGFGWNGRVHGPACMSVIAIDLVNARGELIHADEQQNSELLWAARGAGPGFFGVVTRFHLSLQPRPQVIANGVLLYPIELLDEIFGWAAQVGPQVHRTMELMLFIHRDPQGELEIAVTGPVLEQDEHSAREALAVLQTCPHQERAKAVAPYVEGDFADLFAGAHAAYPDQHRYVADNMWTHAPVEQLLPGLHRIAQTLPPAPSHMLWMNWGPGRTPPPPRLDMAYSVEDDTYIALYGVWQDPAEDAANTAWATQRMREMEPLATGIQLADENLRQRPSRFLSDASLERLRQLRAKHDPHRRFHSWMGPLGETR
ncbi:MAG TPA: FAD-binding oxidoreductase [Solirubrobacteraceae bacterium]